MKHAVFAALLLGTAATAHAGGLARPNAGSPKAVGLAGAFGAVADDASCLDVNPAGCAFAEAGWLAALELVYAPRTYVPITDAGGREPAEDATAVAPAPVVGVLFKPGGRDGALTVGVGAWNTFGGALEWDRFEDPDKPAVNKSRDLVFELAAGAGWAVNDRVAIGAALRVGLGLFAIDASAMPVDTELSASGIGVGATAGVMIHATDELTVGLGWRSNLDVTTTGSADLTLPGGPLHADAEHQQRWPQSASLSAAYAASEDLLFTCQLDWTQWSRFEELVIEFPGAGATPPQIFPLDWSDVLTFRLGGQYTASSGLQLRGGLLRDGSAVPDRTIERQYLDATKYGLALGASVDISARVVIDAALDLVGGPKRTVPDNAADVGAWTEMANAAPGEHNGQVVTVATGVRISL